MNEQIRGKKFSKIKNKSQELEIKAYMAKQIIAFIGTCNQDMIYNKHNIEERIHSNKILRYCINKI